MTLIEDAIKDLCEKCWKKHIDIYGYYCDLSCGTHTAYENQKQGAEMLLKHLFKLAKESPTKTFTIDSRIQRL